VLFTKPAARLFVPDEDVDKNYDVCFMANGTQRKIKRHAFMIKSLAGSGLTVLALGNQTPELRRLAKKEGLDVTWKPWMLRKRLPRLISQCKVGLCCSNETDSAPRVISEYMACGLPVVVTKSVNIDQESYRGKCVEDDKLIYGIKCAKKMKSSRPYYDRYMSIDVCAEDLKNLVEVCIENRI
jgi:glycosyltransferase involved in cell wall biosynthesis